MKVSCQKLHLKMLFLQLHYFSVCDVTFLCYQVMNYFLAKGQKTLFLMNTELTNARCE